MNIPVLSYFRIKYPVAVLCTLLSTNSFAQSWLSDTSKKFELNNLLQLQAVQTGNTIAPFSSDGCSGQQSTSWQALAQWLPSWKKQFGKNPPWESCCIEHDKHYWRGTVENGFKLRKQADETLKQCVSRSYKTLDPALALSNKLSPEQLQNAFSITADLMYRAVRIGGQPCSSLPWRWGYGWEHCNMKQYSDIKEDETLVFFNTAAWLDETQQTWHIPIHAWIYEPQDSTIRKAAFAKLLKASYSLEVSPSTQENFTHRVNLLIADNERAKQIIIRIAGRNIALQTSKANGHINSVIELPVKEVEAFSQDGFLAFFAMTKLTDQRSFKGVVKLITKVGVSVISDIDDTVKVSNVSDHKKLFDHTFYQDFKAVPTMSARYQQFSADNIPIHFVSSSPWQLYSPLLEFSLQRVFHGQR